MDINTERNVVINVNPVINPEQGIRNHLNFDRR